MKALKISFYFTCLVILFSIFHQNLYAGEKPVLRLYNWSTYIDLDDSVDANKPITECSPTLAKFMEKYDCLIEYYEYEDEIDMIKKIHNLPCFFDVVVMTSDKVKSFILAQKLEEITTEKVPNKANIYPKYLNILGQTKKKYFVPYLIGTTGIVYRKDLVGHSVCSWKDYFEPSENLLGKIGALNCGYCMFSFAFQYLNIDIHTTERKSIKKAAKLLYGLKNDGFLSYISSNVKDIQAKLLNGELAMALLYSGDVLTVAEKEGSGHIQYVIPKEGAEYYIDCFVVLKDAPHKDLAYKFIDFVLTPPIHAANAAYLKYICPNKKSVEIIKKTHPEQFENQAIYPDPQVMEKLEIFGNSSPEIDHLWIKIREN